MTPEEIEILYPTSSRQKHKWAADGLTYTCYVLYADQVSGLSSDGVRFDSGGGVEVDAQPGDQTKGEWNGKGKAQPRKWVDVLADWEKRSMNRGVWGIVVGGGEEDKPPGTRNPEREGVVVRRDYTNLWPERWLMRPEVCFPLKFETVF